MNAQLSILIDNWKDGVPVKIERSSIALVAAAAVAVVAASAVIVKLVNKTQ